MNVFFEFHHILRELQRVKTPYALIGGVAMAYYAEARFTKDIDLQDLQKLREGSDVPN